MTGREYPERPLVGVGGVVLDGEKVLLVRRAQAPLQGEWSLPGGLVEVGERLAHAVRREIAEETGLNVRVEGVVKVLDRITRDPEKRVRFHYVLVDYLCRVVGGELRHGSDVTDVTLADPAGLEPYAITAKAEGVIARAVQLRSG